MFVILQKYDFSSKSQLHCVRVWSPNGCLWYCKSTIFQANHNIGQQTLTEEQDVCDTAKVRFFKQITTGVPFNRMSLRMFVILQKYDFSSKSQQFWKDELTPAWCLWYCKSTIFQANHNSARVIGLPDADVCDTAKVRFFKQITTGLSAKVRNTMMFVILQKYDFSSKLQLYFLIITWGSCWSRLDF